MTEDDDVNGPTPVAVLAYQNVRELTDLPPARRSRLAWVAVGCWAVPLLVGAGTLGLYLRSPRNALEHVGGWTIVGGTALSLVGGVAVMTFVARRWHRARNRWRECVGPAV